MPDTQTDIPHPRFARMYPRAAAGADLRGASEHRRKLLTGVSGTVVEVGCGNGLNFKFYGPDVTEALAIEPEPTLREAAREMAADASAPVRVVAGVADSLPVPDASADVVVASLVLCSVQDPASALGEMLRVLRPGGELRFYEHVIPEHQPMRLILQILDRSGAWPKFAGDCHPARDTVEAIRQAGFEIRSLQRIMFSSWALEPAIPFVVGIAGKQG